MNLSDRFRIALRVLREGVDPLTGRDTDEDLRARITGNKRDLTPIEQDKARAIATLLWRQNPMAHRLTEMIVDFVVGEGGITFKAADEAVQERLEHFWNDPAMRLDLRHRDFVRDLSLTGELALRTYPGGRNRIGFIDADWIKAVVKDDENALLDRKLILRPKRMGEADRVVDLLVPDETDPTVFRRNGEGLYYAVNRLTAGHRGTPDLLALADWIDGYDQILWNLIDRSALQNAFIYDVTLEGKEDAEISDWVRVHGQAPKPGTVRAHNEKVKWDAVAPNLGASEAGEASRLVKNFALGGAGLPEGWFADGDSANRATLAAQGDPTYKMLASRQRYVRFIFEDLLAWHIEADVEQGLLPEDVDRSVTVNMPDLNESDTRGLSTAIQQLVAGLTAAVEGEFIDTASARRIFLSVAGQLGVDLDETEVVEAIEEAKAEADAELERQSQEQRDALAAMGLDGAPVPPQNGPQGPAVEITASGPPRQFVAR